MDEPREHHEHPRVIALTGAGLTLVGAGLALLGYSDYAQTGIAGGHGISVIPLFMDYAMLAFGAFGLYWGGRLIARGLVEHRV